MNDAVVIPSITPEQAWHLASGSLKDPFAVLGPFETELGRYVRAFLPGARGVEVVGRADGRHLGTLSPTQPDGLFLGRVQGGFVFNGPTRCRKPRTPIALTCC
jgi:1,4-alpha-glucan branching enzyme